MKVLVIDDDTGVSSLVRDILISKGRDVTVANSPEDAIEESKKARFDLIVTDVNMPGRNGIELASEIKNGAKVLVMSANDENQKKAEEYNFPFILKPFRLATLEATVEALLKN